MPRPHHALIDRLTKRGRNRYGLVLDQAQFRLKILPAPSFYPVLRFRDVRVPVHQRHGDLLG